MLCILFGCKMKKVKIVKKSQKPFTVKYIFYKECVRCKRKTDLSSHSE